MASSLFNEFRNSHPGLKDLSDDEVASVGARVFKTSSDAFKSATGYEAPSDVWRGIKQSGIQAKQLGAGLLAAGAAAGETAAGEGGLLTGAKKWAVGKYQEYGKDVQRLSRETDSATVALERAKQGDFGALVDFAGYAFGQGVGQGAQALASGGLGGIALKTAGKYVANDVASGLVKKEAAKLADSGLSGDELVKAATAKATERLSDVGQTLGVGAFAYGMEGGEIGGGLAEKSVKENRALTPDELVKGLGAAVAAGTLEFIPTKLGYDIQVGKSAIVKAAQKATGLTGVAGRAAVGAATTAPLGAATEYAQTYVEEYGKGEPIDEKTQRAAFDAAAIGAIGEGSMGAIGSTIHGGDTKKDLPTTKKQVSAGQIKEFIDTRLKELDFEEQGFPGEVIKNPDGTNRAIVAKDGRQLNPQELGERLFLSNNPRPESVAKRYGFALRPDTPDEVAGEIAATAIPTVESGEQPFSGEDHVKAAEAQAAAFESVAVTAIEPGMAQGQSVAQAPVKTAFQVAFERAREEQTKKQAKDVQAEPLAQSSVLAPEIAPVPDIARAPDIAQALPTQSRVAPIAGIPNTASATELILPDGKKVAAQWDVVEAEDVKASLKEGVNQPRDRTRALSDVQISEIAKNPEFDRLSDTSKTLDYGAPTLTADGAIVGGNGRFEGVSHAYRTDQAIAYRNSLEQAAERFGLSPATIAGMKEPVLVRRLTEAADTRTLAIQSNQPAGLQLSDVEQAAIDAERMQGLEDLDISDNGEIPLTEKNQRAIGNALKGYTTGEVAGLVASDGALSQSGMRRVRNAILHKAYGKSDTLSRLIESADPDLKIVGTALVRASARLARVRERTAQDKIPKNLNITDNLKEAVEVFSQLKAKGLSVDEYFSQDDIFSGKISDEKAAILRFLADNSRSAKNIAEYLNNYADAVLSIEQSQGGMFGDAPLPTQIEVLDRAGQRIRAEKAAGKAQRSLLDQDKPRTETGNTPAPEADGQSGSPESDARGDAKIQGESPESDARGDAKTQAGYKEPVAEPAKGGAGVKIEPEQQGILEAIQKQTEASTKLVESMQAMAQAVTEAVKSSEKPAEALAGIKASEQSADASGKQDQDDRFYYTNGLRGMTSSGSFTEDKDRWVTFPKDEARSFDERNLKPAYATQRGIFTGVTTGRKLAPKPKPVTPQIREGSESTEAYQNEREASDLQNGDYPVGGVSEAADNEEGQLDLFVEPSADKRQAYADLYGTVIKARTVSYLKAATDVVKTADDLAHLLASIRKEAQEALYAVVTDKRGKVLRVMRHTKGLADQSPVSPITLIAETASIHGAHRLHLGHNHPSGNPTPSSNDVDITDKIRRRLDGTGVILGSHVVIGQKTWQDVENPVRSSPIQPRARTKNVAVTERAFVRREAMGEAVSGPESAARITANHKDAVFLFNNRHYLAGIVPLTADEMKNLRAGGRVKRLLSAINTTNAMAAIIKTSDRSAAINIVKFLNSVSGGDFRTLDWISSGGVSAAARSDSVLWSSGPFFSRSKLPDPILVDGVERPTTDSEGRQIHPTEEGIKNFWKWFSNSKAVGADGRPLRVYHGTGKVLDAFDKAKRGTGAGGRSARRGFFFTDSASVASEYAESSGDFESTKLYVKIERLERSGMFDEAERITREMESPDFDTGARPNVVPVHLSLQNPAVIDFGGRAYDAETDNLTDIIEQAQEDGRDGVILRNLDDAPTKGGKPSDHYIVFEPTQIKSATGNTGAYGANSQNITASRSTEPKTAVVYQTNEANRGETNQLEKYLKRKGHEFTITPVSVSLDSVDGTGGGQANRGAGPQNRFAVAEQIASIFGKRIVWVNAKGQFGINGVVVPGGVLRNIIFIDANTQLAPNVVLGHELSHHMEADNPKAYADLLAAVKGLLKNHEQYRITSGIGRDLTDDAVIKEMLGDIVGDNFGDAEFWNLLGKENPGTISRIANAIVGWIDNIIAKLTGKNLGSSRYVTDLKAARAAVIKAVSEYATNKRSSEDVSQGALYAQVPVNEWYSQLRSVLDKKLPNAGMAESMLKMIDSYKEFKAEELKYSGLREWLSGQTGKITKQEILDQLDLNAVTVETVVLGRDLTNFEIVQDTRFKDIWYAKHGGLFKVDELGSKIAVSAKNEAEARDRITEKLKRESGRFDDTKFADWQLKGPKTNYREVLLTLPARGVVTYTNENVVAVHNDARRGQDPDRFWYFETPDNFLQILKSQHPDEADAKAYVIAKKQPRPQANENFESSHFPDLANPVAHLRMSDRVDAEGRRHLFVDEVQSDWHAEGRKAGYKSVERDRAIADFVRWQKENPTSSAAIWRENNPQMAAAMALPEGGVPDAPFKASWPMLAMKKALRIAVEGGYHSLSWITGKQTQDRYGLSAPADTDEGINALYATAKKLSNILGRFASVVHVKNARGLSSLDIPGGNPARGKPFANRAPVDAKEIGDLLEGKPFVSHGYDGLDVPGKRIVASHVLSLIQDGEVRDSIIKLVPIDMMDNLSEAEFSSKLGLDNEAMLADRDSINHMDAIASAVDVSASSLVDIATLAATKDLPAFDLSDAGRKSFKDILASWTLLLDATPARKAITIGGAKRDGISPAFPDIAINLASAKSAIERLHKSNLSDDRRLVNYIFTTSKILWAVSLYDKQLVNETNKYVKKWGGRVGEAMINGETQHSLRITDQIREGVSAGQPLFSRIAETKDPIAPNAKAVIGDIYTLPPETRTQKALRKLQDEANRFQVVQDAVVAQGGTVNESTDMARAIKRYPGRLAAAMKDSTDNLIEPMLKRIHDAGFTVDEIELLAYAEHAYERNEEIAKINPRFPNDGTPGKSGAGMTDGQADSIIEQARAHPDSDALFAFAEELRDIADRNLDNMVAGGVMAPSQAAAYRAKYKKYIPLKGFELADDRGVTQGTGAGLSTGKKIDMRAYGRSSRAGQLFENVIRDYEKGLQLVEKANVARVIRAFVEANPDDALWSIDKAPKKPYIEKGQTLYQVFNGADMLGQAELVIETSSKKIAEMVAAELQKGNPTGVRLETTKTNPDGIVRYRESEFDKEEEIRFIENSQEVRIQLTDEGMVRSYNRLWHSGVSEGLTLLNTYNAWLRQMYTQKNPAWFVRNFVRDVQTVIPYVTGEAGLKVARKVPGNIYKSFKAAWAMHHNKSAGDMDVIIKQFMASGAYTGFAYVGDIEAQTLRLNGALARYASWSEASRKLRTHGLKAGTSALLEKAMNTAFFSWIEAFNSTFENTTRLAVFKSVLDSGESADRAGDIAKHASTNFNTRGEWGPNINAVWLFSNASFQGTRNIVHALMFSPHKEQVWGLMGGLVALGYMASMLSDDDDDLLDDQLRSKSLIFKAGDSQVSMPMSYGFGFFAGFGQLAAQAMKHPEKRDNIAVKMASLAADHFSPIGNPLAGELSLKNVVNIAPTFPLGRPMLNVLANVSPFGGAPLYPDSPFDKTKPDSEKMWQSTKGSGYAAVAEWLNTLTGGDKYLEGGISVSPQTLKLGVNTVFGGAGRLVSDVVSMPFSENLAWKETPVAKDFYREIDQDAYLQRFYEQAERAENAYRVFRNYQKGTLVDDAIAYQKEEAAYVEMGRAVAGYRKQIKHLKEQEALIANGDMKDRAVKMKQVSSAIISSTKAFNDRLEKLR